MNRIILVLITISFGISAYSQHFTITGGAGLAKIKGDDVLDNVTISNKTTIKIGISTDFRINDNLFVQFGFGFAGKGYKAKDPTHSNDVTMTYFEVPVVLVGKLPLGNKAKAKFLAGAGIYEGIGFHYRTKAVTDNPSGENESIERGDFADFNVRRTDFGLNVLSGFEINEKMQIALNYQHGLSSIFYSFEFGLVKNRYLGISLSYFLD